MLMLTIPPRRRRVRPPATVVMLQQLAPIKARLKQAGYRLRVSVNDAHAWRIYHPDRSAFHLLCYRSNTGAGTWLVLPENHTPDRAELLTLVQEAIAHG